MLVPKSTTMQPLFFHIWRVPPDFLGPYTTFGESGPGKKAAIHGSIPPWKVIKYTQVQQPMGQYRSPICILGLYSLGGRKSWRLEKKILQTMCSWRILFSGRCRFGTFGCRLTRENRLPPPEWPAKMPLNEGNLCGPLASQMAVSSN